MIMNSHRGLSASPLPRPSTSGTIVSTISTASSTTRPIVTSNHDQRRTTATSSIHGSAPPAVSHSRPQTLGVSTCTVSEHPLTPMLRDIKEILLAGQQAQKTEMSKMRTSLCNMQDELAKLQKLVKEESEKGFSIEDSVFKVPF